MTDGPSHTPPPPPPQQPTPPPAGDPTYTPGGAPKKKGLPALAWVGIGCGVIALIVLIVLAAGTCWGVSKVKEFGENPEMNTAKLIVAANPELELVESDDEAGTLTVRNTKTGEEMTVDVSEIKDGRLRFRDQEGQETSIGMEEGEDGEGAFSVRDSEGNETFRVGAGGEENIPGWVPRYPGVELRGTMSSRRGGKVEGAFTFETADPADEVADWYAEELADQGMTETGRSDNRAGDQRLLNLGFEGDGRQTNTMITTDGGKTTAVVSYSEEGGE
jgi:hypothetical protein